MYSCMYICIYIHKDTYKYIHDPTNNSKSKSMIQTIKTMSTQIT